MRTIISLFLCLLCYERSFSQLSGTISIPSASYNSLAAIISTLNQQGVSGPLTIQIAAGYIETAPIGGYSISATGTATAPIIFQKSGSGANPLIVAYSGGNGTPGSMQQDGMIRLIGSDFITIDGISLVDSNTTNPSTMEFGIALFKSDAGNGCWNTTIKNCVISLNRINNASGSGPAMDGSKGIEVVNAVTNVHNSAISVSVVSGSHSYNKFYNNTIQNCNIAIALSGFTDTAPFTLADTGNEIGGTSLGSGNSLLNFGGGGTTNASSAIRTLAQYNLSIRYNTITNNTGTGSNHATTLRGIFLGAAAGANVAVTHNTLSLHSGGVNNLMSLIENGSGSGANSNTVNIEYNLLHNSSYTAAISPSYYGIWNSASPAVLSVSHNTFVNNSSHASGGSTYLIYNNGAVSNSILMMHNQLGFVFKGQNAFAGTLYSIYNSNGTTATSLSVSLNDFRDLYFANVTSNGSIYFINNTNDSYQANISGNTYTRLNLNHSGTEYLIYNSSATQSLLTVCNNSIVSGFRRTAASGAMYGYYGNGNSPAASVHSICTNNFSNITGSVTGTGVFYGIYTTDGNSSPFPKKIIRNNKISDVLITSSGNFYAFYLDKMGDASSSSGSEILMNQVSNIFRSGNLYGLYIAALGSPTATIHVEDNKVIDLNSDGSSASIYGTYLSSGGSGIYFYRNRIANLSATGSSASVYGIYATAAVSNTISTNLVGNLFSPNSSASNALNGIYLNSGSMNHVFYSTVYLNASSSGGNFNSNALYSSSTVSLNVRNCILINTSSGGTGIAAAVRRSSTSLSSYSTSSNSNLFYAGIPSSSNVILQIGATSYQTLSTMQTALSPRESASVTQTLNFLSLLAYSPNYLHIHPAVFSSAESSAASISGIAQDIDIETRHGNSGYLGNGTAPDIGADEFEQNTNPCSGISPAVLSSSSLSVCAGHSISLFSTGSASGTGVSYQWKVSSASGGPYSNVTTGTGITSPDYFSASLSAGVYYFVLESTCTTVSNTAVSPVVSVQVNAIPSVTATVLDNLVCEGQTLFFNAASSGSVNYYWIGPDGFYSTLQNPTLLNVSMNVAGNYSLVASFQECESVPSSVSVSVSAVNLSLTSLPNMVCLGNSATLVAQSSANSYTWNTGANSSVIVVSPSITTIYSVNVTNTANCMAAKEITVSLISPSISATGAVLCGTSGTVSLSVQAFTPSLISWYSSQSSSISVSIGSSFSLSVSSDTTLYAEATHTLSGCSSVRIPVSVTISAIPVISVSANPTVVCPGKALQLLAGGATTYSWVGIGSGASRTVNPFSSVVYTVIGKNAFACSSTQTISVNVHSSPSITAIQSATSVCPSSVLGFTASGAVSYTWNTGAIGSITTVSPATNSSYTVFGSNAEGCVSSKSLAVITRSVPVLSIQQSGDSLCAGELITFTVSGANSYTWYPGALVSTTFSAAPMLNSAYNVVGKSVNTCTQVAFVLQTVNECAGINGIKAKQSQCLVYPNPAKETITVQFSSKENRSIKIYNAQSSLIYDKMCLEDFEEINVSDFKQGFYILMISVDLSKEYLKLIKE